MSPKLPVVKPKILIKTLSKMGFIKKRQHGSHLILWHPSLRKIIPIPIHAQEIKKGTLKSIIRQSGLTKDQFIKLLKEDE